MPGTFVPDTRQGYRADASASFTRVVRTGIVTGIELAATNDPGLLNKVLESTGFPLFESQHPAHPELLMKRVLVEPIDGFKDVVRVALIYESVQFLGPPSAWLITKRGITVNEPVNTILTSPAQMLLLGYNGPATRDYLNGTASTEQIVVAPETTEIVVARNYQVVDFSSLTYGAMPETTIHDWLDRVNDATFYGKGPGFWKIADAKVTQSLYAGYHTVSGTIVSRPDRDWSEVKVMVNRRTGKYIPVNLASYLTVLAAEYAHGKIVPANNAPPGQYYNLTEGFIRVGPYQTQDFSSLMSFGV